MIAALKPGITLDTLNGPIIETERLILRPWRGDDIAPNLAMLGGSRCGPVYHRRW